MIFLKKNIAFRLLFVGPKGQLHENMHPHSQGQRETQVRSKRVLVPIHSPEGAEETEKAQIGAISVQLEIDTDPAIPFLIVPPSAQL